MKEADFGALYLAADSTSLKGQDRFLNCTKIRQGGLVVAAVGGAFTLSRGDLDAMGLLAFAAFLVVLGTEFFLLLQQPERVWYEGRAGAESVKTLAWRFMVGGEPFSRTLNDRDARSRYLERVNEVLQDLNDIELVPDYSTDRQITDRMQGTRALSLDERQTAYERDRVEDQRAWYARKASWNAKQAFRWSVAAIVLEFGGLFGAAFKAFGATDVDVLGILAAAAAGVAGWAQAKQYRTLHQAYFVASQELASIRSQIDSRMTEVEWAQFVQEAEEAISREHTLWRASRGLRVRPL